MIRWLALCMIVATSFSLSAIAQGAGDKKESDGKKEPAAKAEDGKSGEAKSADSKSSDSKSSDTKSSDAKSTDVTPTDAKIVAPRRAGKKNARGVYDLSFDDLKFDIEKGAKFDRKMLPQTIEDYKDKKLSIRGYILPLSISQQHGIRQFVLVRDDKECCFGPMAAIYDCMRIEMDGGPGVSFTTRPITVEGVFDIQEFAVIDGRPMAIYHVKATSAK